MGHVPTTTISKSVQGEFLDGGQSASGLDQPTVDDEFLNMSYSKGLALKVSSTRTDAST